MNDFAVTMDKNKQRSLDLISEKSWVTAAQNGDENAIGNLFKHYEKRLFKMIYLMIRDYHDAEDLTQQTIIKAINGLVKYVEEGQFHSWLFRIARNETLNYLKKQTRYRETLELYSYTYHEFEDISESVSQKEELQLLAVALEQLQIEERELLILRLYQGLKFREIAEITGDSLNTVLGRMRRATHRLQKILNHQTCNNGKMNP